MKKRIAKYGRLITVHVPLYPDFPDHQALLGQLCSRFKKNQTNLIIDNLMTEQDTCMCV